MRCVIAFLLCLLTTPALAQKTKAALTTQINSSFPDNTSGRITPAVLRTALNDIVQSYYDLNGLSSASCITNQWISGLPTLSSVNCAQPTISSIAGLAAGVPEFLTTPSSANLAAAVTGETGTGALVFGTSPTISTGFTLGYITGSTQCLHVDTNGAVTGTGSDCGAGGGGGSPGGSNTQVQYNNAGAFGGITGATTNGTTLTLVAPVLGTPASGTLTNTTGFPVANLAGADTGCLTWIATPTSANLRGCLTDETGTGIAYFVGGALGTPSSATLTNGTGLPVATGISGLGTGVATALGVNVGSAGAPVLFNGAGGTPSSMTGTNITGTASGLTAGTASAVAVGGITGLGTGVATWLATPSSANLASAVTGETGSGALVFATSPTLVTPDIGTPSAGVGTNITSLNASNLSSGTVAAARGGAGTVNGVLAGNGSGAVSQGTCAGLSGVAASCATDATNASNISSGTLNNARLAYNSTILNGAPTNPTGTTSATLVMSGLGVTTCRITPAVSTRVYVIFTGAITSSSAGGITTIRIQQGTGAGPANGAAVTGTAIGNANAPTFPSANQKVPFAMAGIITGLTPATTIWLDLAIASSAGTGTIDGIGCIAYEL